MKSAGNYSLRNHHPGVDCVHADFAWAEFLRQCSRDRIDRAFRCVVNDRSRWSQGTGERTDVDDTSAIGVEMLQPLLSGEEHSENVRIKHSVELLLGDFFQRHELVNAGVVDHDVDLPERFLRSANSLSTSAFFATLALHRDSFSAALGDFIDHAIRVLLEDA